MYKKKYKTMIFKKKEKIYKEKITELYYIIWTIITQNYGKSQ